MLLFRAAAGLILLFLAALSTWDAAVHYMQREEVPWGRKLVLRVVVGDLCRAGDLVTDAVLYGLLGVHPVPTVLVLVFGTGSFVVGMLTRLGKWEQVPMRVRKPLRFVGWPLGLAFLAAFIPRIRWGIVAAYAAFFVINSIGVRRIWRLLREDPAFGPFLRRERPPATQ